MPVARFQMPDGRIGRFEVPEGTTAENAQSLIEQHLSNNPDIINPHTNTNDNSLASLADTAVGKSVGGSVDAATDILGNIYGTATGKEWKDVTPTPQLDVLRKKGWSGTTTPEKVGAAVEALLTSPTGKIAQLFGANLPAVAATTAISEANPVVSKVTGIPEQYLQAGELLGGGVYGAAKSGYLGGKAKGVADATGGAVADKTANVQSTIRDMVGDNSARGVSTDILPESHVITPSKDAFANSQTLYKQGLELGAKFDPKLGVDIAKKATSLKETGFKGNLDASEKVYNRILDRVALSKKGIDLSDFDKLDKDLTRYTNELNAAGRRNDLAKNLNNLKYEIRDMVRNPEYLRGSPQGVQLHSEAVGEWHRASKLRDMENLIAKSQTTTPKRSLQTAIKNFRANENKMRGYTAEEKAALAQAEKTGIGTGLIDLFGSRMINAIAGAAGGGATGGWVGAAGGTIAGKAAGGAVANYAGKLQANRLNKLAGKAIMESKGGMQTALPEDVFNVVQRVNKGRENSLFKDQSGAVPESVTLNSGLKIGVKSQKLLDDFERNLSLAFNDPSTGVYSNTKANFLKNKDITSISLEGKKLKDLLPLADEYNIPIQQNQSAKDLIPKINQARKSQWEKEWTVYSENPDFFKSHTHQSLAANILTENGFTKTGVGSNSYYLTAPNGKKFRISDHAPVYRRSEGNDYYFNVDEAQNKADFIKMMSDIAKLGGVNELGSIRINPALAAGGLAVGYKYLQGEEDNKDQKLKSPYAKPSKSQSPKRTPLRLDIRPDKKQPVKPQAANDLFHRVIQQESGGKQFDKKGKPLKSKAGAIGIAQLMPKTAPEAAKLAGVPFDNKKYRTDANYNAKLGKAYLSHLLDKFDGNEVHALMAYNWGKGNVRSWIKQGKPIAKVPQETKQYVLNILGAKR